MVVIKSIVSNAMSPNNKHGVPYAVDNESSYHKNALQHLAAKLRIISQYFINIGASQGYFCVYTPTKIGKAVIHTSIELISFDF